jgi:hypothetical protein
MKRTRRLRRFLKLALRTPFEVWVWPAERFSWTAFGQTAPTAGYTCL